MRYNSKMMNSIWGRYNEDSVHNFKSLQCAGKVAAEFQQTQALQMQQQQQQLQLQQQPQQQLQQAAQEPGSVTILVADGCISFFSDYDTHSESEFQYMRIYDLQQLLWITL